MLQTKWATDAWSGELTLSSTATFQKGALISSGLTQKLKTEAGPLAKGHCYKNKPRGFGISVELEW